MSLILHFDSPITFTLPCLRPPFTHCILSLVALSPILPCYLPLPSASSLSPSLPQPLVLRPVRSPSPPRDLTLDCNVKALLFFLQVLSKPIELLLPYTSKLYRLSTYSITHVQPFSHLSFYNYTASIINWIRGMIIVMAHWNLYPSMIKWTWKTWKGVNNQLSRRLFTVPRSNWRCVINFF